MMDQVTAPKGIYAAVATPFNRQHRPDHGRYLKHCQWLLDHGCDGLVPLGTTGEATSLGLVTKQKLVEALAKSGLPMKKMIIGTGSTSIEDTVVLSKTALEVGAAGLLMLPPFYYDNPSEDGLFRYFAAITSQLLQRHRPQIFLYHIPIYTGINITVELTARLRAEFPNAFVGIKDSGADFGHTVGFIKTFPGFAAFSGTELFAMNNLLAGGWGCISATANLTAPAVAHRIRNRSQNNQALSNAITLMRQKMTVEPGAISTTKNYLALYKRDTEWNRTMPPHTPVIDERSLATLFDSLQPTEDLRKLYAGLDLA